MTRLLEAGDLPEKSYIVRRCTGLEVQKGLLLWCREAIYINGFEQTDGDGLEGKINRLQMSGSTLSKSQQVDPMSSSNTQNKSKEDTCIVGNTRQRMSFADFYSVYRRRYQLQQIVMVFLSTEEREEVLLKVLHCPLPNSIFSLTSISGAT